MGHKWKTTLFLAAVVLSVLGCKTQTLDRDTPVTSEPVRGEHRLTGRAWLVTGEAEAPGYGLYSYILFNETPHSGNRDLFLAVLDAYLGIQEINHLEEADVAKQDLNITYLPVRVVPPENPSAEWLLAYYDFARALVLSTKIGATGHVGPIIASHASPLWKTGSINRETLLMQDLSAVPDEMAFLWVREFIQQVSQPRYWQTRTVHRLMLGLRTKIAVVAEAFDLVSSAQADINKKIKILE